MLVVVFAFLCTLSTWSFAGGVAFLFAGAVWAAVEVFEGRLTAFTFELAASALAVCLCLLRVSLGCASFLPVVCLGCAFLLGVCPGCPSMLSSNGVTST